MNYSSVLSAPACLHRDLSASKLEGRLAANERQQNHTRYAHERLPLRIAHNAAVGARGALWAGRPLTLPFAAVFGTGQPTGHVTDVGLLPALGHVATAAGAGAFSLVGAAAGLATYPVAALFGKSLKGWVGDAAAGAFDKAWYVGGLIRRPVEAFEHAISASVNGTVASLGALVAVAIGLPGNLLNWARGAVSHDDHLPGEPCVNEETLIEGIPLAEMDKRFFFRLSNGQGFDIREFETHILTQRRWTSPWDLSPVSAEDIARIARHPSGIGKRLLTKMTHIEGNLDDIRGETLGRLHSFATAILEDKSDFNADAGRALLAIQGFLSDLPESESHALDIHVASANGGTLSERLAEVSTKMSCTRVFAHELMARCATLQARTEGRPLPLDVRGKIDQAYVASEFRFLIARHVSAGKAWLGDTLRWNK